ncbi:MAG: Fic family protein, partial [Lachnospiraceae bacterium]|nr:Fic family protein [Lachnospiraceae bacterium]
MERRNSIAISMGKRQLVDSIWKSAGIEGLGTTFPNTQRILDNLPVETNRDEVLFIVNMKRAWEFLFDNIDHPNNLMFLRELNKISMNNIIYGVGELRKVPVTIGGTDWTPELPHEGTIISDIERINSLENKEDASLEMFCYIARTQIFLDGNKRAAQLMCNKMLMQEDIGILSIPYKLIDYFKELLVKFYESNNNQKLKN